MGRPLAQRPRDMDMQVMFFKIIVCQPVFRADRTHIGKSRLSGFFHYISQLSGHFKRFPFPASHCLRSEEYRLRAGPGQSPYDSHLVLLICILKGNLFLSQIFFQIAFRDADTAVLLILQITLWRPCGTRLRSGALSFSLRPLWYNCG